jgi:hypothetical protein
VSITAKALAKIARVAHSSSEGMALYEKKRELKKLPSSVEEGKVEAKPRLGWCCSIK